MGEPLRDELLRDELLRDELLRDELLSDEGDPLRDEALLAAATARSRVEPSELCMLCKAQTIPTLPS